MGARPSTGSNLQRDSMAFTMWTFTESRGSPDAAILTRSLVALSVGRGVIARDETGPDGGSGREAMSPESVQLRREDLYEQVWAEPMRVPTFGQGGSTPIRAL